MTRTRFAVGLGLVLALVLALSLASDAAAQPGGKAPPPTVQFKQFGSTPEQFYKSSVFRWTGQLALDLEAIKGAVAGTKLAPVARAGINAQVENALLRTLEVEDLVRKGAARDKTNAAFADVDKALGALAGALDQHPQAKQAAAAPFARAEIAYQQLAAAVGAGDDSPERLKRRLVRLGDALDDAVEDLRALCADQVPGADRDLDRALAVCAREARLLARRARDDAELVKRGYDASAAAWADALTRVGRVRAVPAAVGARSPRPWARRS